MIARCGGNKNTITQQIDAFHDMNTFYRDVNNDDAFKVDRFSGFVELQKTDVKDSIFALPASTSRTSAAGSATARSTASPTFGSSRESWPTTKPRTSS